MIDKARIETELEAFIKNNFPEALEDYEIVLRPSDAPDMKTNMQVQNLVRAIYYCYLQATPQSTTHLYILVSMFASAFKEQSYLNELDKLWKGVNKKGKIELSIPTIETIVIRDLSSLNFKINQKYNKGHGKVYRLADLNQQLLDSKRTIMSIFNAIYLKNDLDIPMQIPALMQQSDGGVMQPL